METVPAHLTDEALLKTAEDQNSPGYARAARHLIKVPAEVRVSVRLRANEISNTSGGWRYSDAVECACKEYLRNPEGFVERVKAKGERCREVQEWERAQNLTASFSAWQGRPGDRIEAM